MNRGGMTVYLHQHKVLIISQLPTLTHYTQGNNQFYPLNEAGWHIGWPGHIWRELFTPVSFQNLHHAARM